MMSSQPDSVRLDGGDECIAANRAIAIAICTHDPDERLFKRALAAVAAQTHAPSECVIVDNNSNPPLETRPVVRDFLARHAAGRVVVEPQQGLTFARIAAVEATSSPILCFVDDDNELAPDYLAEASRIFAERGCIAVLGAGRITVDFVDGVSDWFAANFRHHFQEKDVRGLTYGSVAATWTDYYPPGSGMAVRRNVMLRYRDAVLEGSISATGRTGRSMASGDDTQIVWEAVKMQLAAGISGDMRLTHMIPAKRSSLTYMRRLLYGTSSSYLPALVQSFPETKRDVPTPPSNADVIRRILRIVTRGVLRRRWKMVPLELATYAGSTRGVIRASGTQEPAWLRRIVALLGLE